MASIYTNNHYGTAPRRVSSGQWVTRTGRQLTAAGSAYWEKRFRTGHTDGNGHIVKPSVVQAPVRTVKPRRRTSGNLTQRTGPVKKPGFDTYARIKKGTASPQELKQATLYKKSKAARAEQKQAVQAAVDQHLFGQMPAVYSASKVVSPIASSIITAMSPTTSIKEAAHAAAHGNIPGAGLALSAIIPAGRGGRVIKAGIDAERAASKAAHAGKMLYHGSPEGEITSVDALYHTKSWREGPGFYLTTDPEKAAKYAAGKTAKTERKIGAGAVNQFRLKPDAKVLNLDAAPESYWIKLASEITGEKVTPAKWKEWASDISGKGMSTGIANRQRLLHYLTGFQEIPQSEAYYVMEEALHNRGIQATLHHENGVPVYVVKDEAALQHMGLAQTPEDAVRAERAAKAAEKAGVVLEDAGHAPRPPAPKLPLDLPPTAEEKVFHAATSKEAKKALNQQQYLQSQERARRFVEQDPAFEQAGGGIAGAHAARAQLKGKLPTVQFDQLKNLPPEQRNILANAIQHHPDLLPGQKTTLHKAMDNLYEGKVPQPHEVRMIGKAFGPDAEAEANSLRLIRRLGNHAADVLNIPRSLMSTLDISFVMRQALIMAAHDPKLVAKQLGPMFRAMAKEGNYQDIERMIESHPNFERWQKSGVNFTTARTQRLGGREEGFQSPLAEKIPVIKHPIKGSSRAYTAIQNLLRLHAAEDMAHGMEGFVASGEFSQSQLDEGIAKFVNWATGRGSLGKGKYGLEGAAVPLNVVLFAPRLIASRLQTFNPMFYASLPKPVRMQAMAATFKLVGAGMTILSLAAMAGAKVSANPTNSDFGKIKIGNTRLDIWGGHQQYARIVAQIQQGKIQSSTTGATTLLSGGFGHSSRWDTLARFGQGKLSPPASIVADWMRGTDFAGQPFSVKNALFSRSYPLVVQDALDVARDTNNPLYGVGAFGIAATGIGLQNYKAKPPKVRAKKVGATGQSIYGGSSGSHSIYSRSGAGSHSIYRR